MTTAETWRPVVGFEERYEVSDQGRVRSLLVYSGVRSWPRVEPLVLRPIGGPGHYPTVQLGSKNRRTLHLLVLAAFVGPRPAGYHGTHLNADWHDNRLENLRWVPQSENQLHRVRRAVSATCAVCGAVFTRGAAKLRQWRMTYCSPVCAGVGHRGAGNARWKGDLATDAAGRYRARTTYPLGPCAECGKTPAQVRIERHHVDRNPLNNDPSNIRFLCSLHHSRLHAALITHCRHGHLYTPENTYVDAHGHRSCRACKHASFEASIERARDRVERIGS